MPESEEIKSPREAAEHLDWVTGYNGQVEALTEAFEARDNYWAAKIKSLEGALRKAEASLEDARSYVAEIAQGAAHYPHGDREPCIRCDYEKAQAEARSSWREWNEY